MEGHQRRGHMRGQKAPTPGRINTSYFHSQVAGRASLGQPNPAAEGQGPRSDVDLPKARARSDHVGMSIFWKQRRVSWVAAGEAWTPLCAFSQDDLTTSRLPL